MKVRPGFGGRGSPGCPCLDHALTGQDDCGLFIKLHRIHLLRNRNYHSEGAGL